MELKKASKDFCLTILTMVLCTIVSFLFVKLKIRIENIIMIYLVGVLFIVILTRNFLWGIAGSFLSIVTFNYFFTQPTYSLEIYDPNYIITILIFLIVSIIAGSLVNKMQQHAALSRYNEKQTLALYGIIKDYLNMSGLDSILIHNIHALYDSQKIISVFYYYDKSQERLVEYRKEAILEDSKPDEALAKWCYEKACECGLGTVKYPRDAWTYYPLQRNRDILGVYAIYRSTLLNDDQKLFMNTLISQMLLAIDRERLYEEQEQSRVEIEKEKLRNNLLRSISHDLRTPLTGIAGSSSLMIDNYDQLDHDTVINLLKSISNDALWLTQMVENLLNMTRIQDGKLMISKQKEVVDDILYEATRRCESRKGNHTFEVHLPQDVMLVKMDGKLIAQVLINFIDNAIKHTQDDSIIDISMFTKDKNVCFEVRDNGPGIDESITETLFDSFVTTKQDRADSKRGVGLGLSICKAIVEAHDGEIYTHNREDMHGAVFGFTLPYEEEKNNE